MKGRIIFVALLVLISFGCAKSGNKKVDKSTNVNVPVNEILDTSSTTINRGRSVVPMKFENGVYLIPVEINGVKLSFIFDTGASIVSISQLEATLLFKQGTLSEDDFLGTSQFIDATGTVSEGAIINLKTLKVGNITLNNIRASVVMNAIAPLLLGQSAISQMGKYTIDNDRHQVIFN